MTTTEIIATANNVLKTKVFNLTASKINPANLSFGAQCSNGVTVLFGKIHTYVHYNGQLYKAV